MKAARYAICSVPWERGRGDAHSLVEREWLVTNGLGGYASGTIAGVVARRYHGLLVAALPNPLGRTIMLNTLRESAEVEGSECVPLNSEHRGGTEPDVTFANALTEFCLELGVPTWRFEVGGSRLEKRVFMPYLQNTVVIMYRLLPGDDARPLRLRLTPSVHFRRYESPVNDPLHDYSFAATADHFSLTTADFPPLRLLLEGRSSFALGEELRDQMVYRVEGNRGYESHGALWSPGTFLVELRPGETAAIVASTEELDVMRAMDGAEALDLERERRRRLIEAADGVRDDVAAQLVIAADQFIIRPVGRIRDKVRSAALGEEVRTVIAGYHWFTDWGRDTMISLEGLALVTGRNREAGFILRTFAHYVRDGLIPNMFPDGSDEGLYHTADATLWFFHALERYGQTTGYWALVEEVLPVAREIVESHLRGTRFGIGVDPEDGLLRQGADGYQLTWMDAKVDDWVVTPRRGKPVEINALWYNALCLLSRWECDLEEGDRARSRRYSEAASRARESFNRRFWYERGWHLYDVIDGPDGDDPACRPNQVFAIALDNPVLEESRWESVMSVVQERLLTPVGLRSLAQDHPDYKPRYFGDLRARDAAYHQGTVWGWLIGPWVDAWLKVHPEDRAGARRFLDGLVADLPEFGIGTVAEIFDAESPYTPRGCIAQAWSVAELLRCWVRTASSDGR